MAEKIKGLKELNKQLDKLKKIEGEKATLEGIKILMKYSQENAPVDTGFLRDSHEAVETDEGAELRINAPYAVHVEYGTSRMPAHPFLRPAIDRRQKEIAQEVGIEVEKEIEKKL